MRICCRDMALLMRNGIVTFGNPKMDTLAEYSVDNVTLPTANHTYYFKYCPFCGQKIKIEFGEEEKE